MAWFLQRPKGSCVRWGFLEEHSQDKVHIKTIKGRLDRLFYRLVGLVGQQQTGRGPGSWCRKQDSSVVPGAEMLGRFQRAAGIDSMLESLLSADVRCIPTMLPSLDSVSYLGCQLEGASYIPIRSFQSLSHTSVL